MNRCLTKSFQADRYPRERGFGPVNSDRLAKKSAACRNSISFEESYQSRRERLNPGVTHRYDLRIVVGGLSHGATRAEPAR